MTEVPDDVVTIPMDEYVNLIAIATNMETVTRWAKAHNSVYDKVNYNELLLLLDVLPEKE